MSKAITISSMFLIPMMSMMSLGGRSMQKKRQRLAILVLLAVGVLVALPTTASAAMMTQLSGDAYYDNAGDVCGPPPPGYADFTSYPPLVMRGSLAGCWYTKVETSRLTSSGAYLETGEEVFVGTLNGGPAGTFATTYRFEAKLDPNGAEIRGRCQHPIVQGSGTGGFEGASGLVLFRDIIPEYFYRGHINLE
jgi:hypothetical protein